MSTKILVVDDEPGLEALMKQRFRHKILSGYYSFRYAMSGRDALRALNDDPEVDVLLLDINMPDMDGLTLLGYLPESVPTSRAVMVSAYGDLTNVRTAMNRGAFDFVMKPINFQDLELTIEKTAQHVSQLRESIHTKAVADLKARFFDNITHEFRTPLSLILAPVDSLLQSNRHDEPTRRSLLTIRRNAHQLLQLINQLLDLAKLETDTLPIIESPGEIVAFLDELIVSFRSMAEQKSLSLTLKVDSPVQEALFDADKWQKIIANLISNAIKFTAAGGQVSIQGYLQPDQLTLQVMDTGIGIPPEHLNRVFDRFYQVDTSTTRAYEGSGIGLALAYELARRLGGQLSVESEPGQGTTFSAQLPFKAIQNPELLRLATPIALLAEPGAVIAVQSEVESDASNPLILLVEDNTELMAFMAESLASQFRIMTATNGREGLEIALRELPEIVVSDVMMPEMDGYQLTHRLKNDPATNHIAVMLLTARSAPQNRWEGLTEGADDYMTKPFDLTELQLRLHNIISRQQKLRDYYHRQFAALTEISSPPVADSLTTSSQDAFLTKLSTIMETHLDDSSFRTESLAEALAMSVRTLTRKLRTITGVSPARLIRTYRLRRATELLQSGHHVSETAYMVGFEHPSNFATAFREVYGYSPSEFITTHSR